MAKRQTVLLANPLKLGKHKLAGNWISAKLDGCRAVWDGGVSRGVNVRDVPWANTEKDKRDDLIATGLWSRYFKPIFAPDWWLERMPDYCVDGELYYGPGGWERVQSITSRLPENRSDTEWAKISYRAFDVPDYRYLFMDGPVDMGRGIKYTIIGAPAWWKKRGGEPTNYLGFEGAQKLLKATVPDLVHPQEQLPFMTMDAITRFEEIYHNTLSLGEEGVIVRKRNTIWMPHRCDDLLKYKPRLDSEGTVIGYVTGRKTGLGSKLLGKMGAAILDWEGVRFELSGFDYKEREFDNEQMREWARENPETICPDWVTNATFPRGTRISFKYRELSAAGVPKEAAYWRKRPEGS
jgi:DNA ligase-1